MALRLHEELMLLVVREREGTLHSVAWPTALGAALLADLVEAGRLAIVPEGKKLFVAVTDPRPTGDPLLDDCLALAAAAKRRGQLASWISRFARVKDLKGRVARALCARGILRADERTILLLFRQKIYPELDPRPEREIRARLRRLIFAETTARDPRTILLLSLADALSLLPALFEKRQLKERRRWVAQLVADEPLGRKVRELNEAAQAAAIAATC